MTPAEQSAGRPLRFAEFDTAVGTLSVVTAPGERGDLPCGDDGPVVASGFRPMAQTLASVPPRFAGRGSEPGELADVSAAVAAFTDGDGAALDSVSVALVGGDFTLAVWRAMRGIAAGSVATYSDLAAAAGRPSAARAAGTDTALLIALGPGQAGDAAVEGVLLGGHRQPTWTGSGPQRRPGLREVVLGGGSSAEASFGGLATGGAIALGHPLGASGVKLMTTMLHHLEDTGGRFGFQVMCEGGGQANATVIERL